jgi:hypothetical protein
MLLLVVGGSFTFFISQIQNQNNKSVESNEDVAGRFNTLQLPLDELSQAGQINLTGGKTLSINGQLKVNNTLILTPSSQPTGGIAGQIYYDQTNNVLSYYNGTQFVNVAAGDSFLQSLGGLTGAVTIGGGLTASGGTLTNSGVLSLQGQTGAVTLTAGSGIAIDGTTIANSGILSFGGQTGSINVGNGLSITGGELKNSGVVGVSAGTNISIVDSGNGVYTISSSAGGGNVSTVGGTSGKIAKFTGVNSIADSLISETGSSIIVAGDLDVTGQLDLGTPLEVINGGTGANTLAANGVLVGNGTSAISSVTAGGTGLCFMSTAGAPAFSACPSAAGVDMLNGLTGTLTIANATATGSTITINDASTAQKGIASFSSTNFTASSGAINTIQDINTTAAPTFGRLTVTSSQAASTMMLVNNTNAGATGNLLDLQTSGVTQMSISPAGAMTLLGTINGQTISSAANFTGTLGVTGLASLSGGATVTGTLTANTITPTSAMTVGATGQSLLLQGNASSSLTATDGASTTTVSFATPTANVTYQLQTAAAGTYDICTTVGNCAGTGGGVTTLGGTTNRLSKFTSSQVIGDSIISDDGSTATINGTLAANTITPTGAMTIGATGQSFLLQGNASSTFTSTDSGNTTTLSFQTPTADVIYRVPTAVAGTYDICTTVGNCAGTGGGVTTLGGTAGRIAKFTASQTIADSLLSESGTTITVNGTLTANTITPTSSLTVGGTGQSFLLQGSATSTITSTDSSNTTTLSFETPTANVTYQLQTATAGTYNICTSANNCGYANASLSNLSSVAINTSLLPGSAGAIDVGSSSLPFRDIYVAGSSGTPASNNFRITGTATGARTITLPDASGTVCIDTNNCDYVSLQASTPGSAQTGNINVGGTIIAGTSMQAPLLNTADATSGSTAALTLRTGDLTGGSSTATGDLTIRSGNASGTAQNSGNISIDTGTATGTTGTLSVGAANASTLTIGNTSAALSLYGTAASTMTFQDGANTTTLSFQTPTASVTYVLPTAAAGSYDICTTVGNCAGTGGGVTTLGGTSGKIAKFTGSQTIADSLISESGTTITIDGDLNLTSGHVYQVDGTQISSADLSNGANLAKLNITQTFTGATNSFKNASDSTDAFNVQNASSQSLLAADTTNGQIILGTASALAGQIKIHNATNSNSITIIPSVATASRTLTLPDESGIFCTTGSICTGYAASSGSTGYIQNQSAAQQTADGWISGTFRADTALQSPGLDTAVAGALNIGTTNATSISIGTSATITAGASLTVIGGNTASRPSSPTEGMVYYDTTTNQLLTYANGKWQSDRNTSTKIVAASNSAQVLKDMADYVTDGTNDETEINAALTAAAGGKVYLVEGTYTASGTILIPNNTTLYGSGDGTLIQLADLAGTSDNLIENSDTSTGTSVAIQDLRLDGQKASQTGTPTQRGIYFNNMGDGTGATARQGGKIQKVKITNFRTNGIYFYYSDNNIIDSSFVQNNSSDGIYFGQFVTNNAINDSSIQANGSAGISISGNSSDNKMIGNTVRSNSGNGIETDSSTTLISNNTLASNGADGISTLNALNSNFTGNVITSNSGRGIVVYGASGTISNDNVINSNGSDGIYVRQSSDVTIANNKIGSNSGSGINIIWTNRASMTANLISGNSGSGISSTSLYETNNCNITGNTLYNNAGSGSGSAIELRSGWNSSLPGGTGNLITSNIITDTAGTGYAIEIGSYMSNTYLSNNTYSGTGATSINDSGTNTSYANQVNSVGDLINRGQNGLAIGTTSATSTLSVQGSYVSSSLSAPTAPTVTTVGAAGATSYTYAVSAYDGFGETLISTTTTTTTGNATLTGSNYNRISWSRISGAVSYNIYRTASGGTPSSTGLIGTVNSSESTMQLNDTGLTASGSTPTSNTTGGMNLAGGLQGTTATFGSANALTLGTSSSTTGAIVFKGSGGTGSVTLSGPSNPTGARTITLPDEDGTVCTTGSVCSGYAPASGSSSYIQNTTTVQSNANIAIQSASDSSITALIRERASQTADIFRIEDSGSNYMLTVDAYGRLQVAQSASLNSVVGIGGMGASSGEKLRIGILDATDIGLNIYGNGSQTADLLRITAGGAQPILAVGGSGQVSLQNRTDSTTALTVSNASSQTLFRVDTSNNLAVVGNTGGQAGGLAITDGTYTNTLSSDTLTTDRSIALPDEDGTICLQNSTACGFAASSGSSSYIQNQIASQQSSSNFWISTIGRADTAFQAPLIDTATSTALNVGTTNATSINLNQDTVVAASKQLTVTSAITTLTGATTGDALVVSNSTSTGRIAVFKDNGTEVFTIDDGGSTAISTTTNSTTAFTVQGTAGSPVLYANTANNTVRLRTLWAGNTGTFDAIWLQGNKNGVTAFMGDNDNVDTYGVNESSANIRWNGSNLAWGDIGYYPTGGGDGSYGQFRFSTTGSAINTTPNAKVGVGSLYAATEIGINNTSPSEALDVSGNINVGSANSYKIGGVIAMETSGDYLRVNQSSQFSNGIYTGTSGLRVGGTTGILVGSAGGDGQIALVPNGIDNTRRITLDGGTGSISAYTGSFTGATSGDALTVSNSTSTDNILVLKDDSTTVATVADGGATTFQNSTNSTAAFRVLNATGSSLFSIDSTNGGLASLLGMNSGETGSWSSVSTALTASRAYAGTATANGYVYVVGGNSTTTPQSTVYYAKINSDGTTGAWTTNTYALPAATSYTTAVALNGYLYILGGSDSGGTEQSTVYFTRLNSDGSTGSWYTTTSLPAARSNGSAFSVNGYMYYIGGQNSSNTAQNTTYYAKINSDGTLDSWTAGSTITNARKSAQVITANGYLYVAGGADSTDTYQSTVYYATLNAGTGAIGTFASTSALPGARAEGGALLANGYMYVIGGRDSSTYQTSVYYSKLSGSDGTAGTWATATSALPVAEGGRGAYVANGYLNVIGGYNGSATSTTVYSSSAARVQIGASLDLVGLQTTNATTAGDATQGSTGGSVIAGNGTFVGTMQVQGMTNLSQGLNVNGITTLEGDTYVSGTLSLSSTIAAYEGFENVTFPPTGATGTWTTGGDANWARNTSHYVEGSASAASGSIIDDESSWLDVDYTWTQAGSITFEWDVSSETGWDFLAVCVDHDSTCDIETDYTYRISGVNSGWQQINIPMTAGAHSIRWVYGKDGSASAGDDMGWIDNVRFNGGEGKITGNGINFSPAAGYNITIGDDDTAAALFVLDRYNGADDPAGTNGGMYYSTYDAKFRCYENSVWKDCINTPLTTRLHASSIQSIANATDTRLVFESTEVDDAPITITDDNKFTFNRAGRYEVSANVRFAAAGGGTGERYLAIAQSVASGQPNPRFAHQTTPGSSSYSSSLNVSTIIDIWQDDVDDDYTISIYAFQNSGAALNTNNDWNGTNVTITWLGYRD